MITSQNDDNRSSASEAPIFGATQEAPSNGGGTDRPRTPSRQALSRQMLNRLRKGRKPRLGAIIMTLVGQGLQGVEAFYPIYDRQDTQHYLDVAQKYGLLVSGGSDYRGFPGRGTEKIGQFTIEDVYAENFYRPPHSR